LDSQVDLTLANMGSDIEETGAAGESTQAARANILNQPATAMLAQANLSPETVFNLLQA
jgi:flagellin-like hook-associated protein FlgL